MSPAPSAHTTAAAATTAERGSGTVLVVGGMGVVALLTAAGLHLGGAATAAHRARAAADLAALAAASVVQSGMGDPCAVAEGVARRNGARLAACEEKGGERVMVRVSTAVTLSWPGVPKVATASAMAGPVVS